MSRGSTGTAEGCSTRLITTGPGAVVHKSMNLSFGISLSQLCIHNTIHRGRATSREVYLGMMLPLSCPSYEIILHHTQLSILMSELHTVESKGFQLSTKNRSLYFIDPTTGVHTQHVESYLNRVKGKWSVWEDVMQSNSHRISLGWIYIIYKEWARFARSLLVCVLFVCVCS